MIFLQAQGTNSNPNTVFDILAIIGALAWLAPLFTWIRNKVTEPSIMIIPYKQLEIGYTIYGSIINIHLSFLAKDKNALINKIKIKLHHEKNETNIFTWSWFEEEIYQVENPELGSIPVKKNQRAIAINALNSVLVEKKIGFQIPEFKNKYDTLYDKAKEVYTNLKSNWDENKMQSSIEYNRVIDYFENSSIWKIGKYKAIIEVFILKRNTPFTHTIEFELNSEDLKSIKKNIETCKSVAHNHFISPVPNKPIWEWIFAESKGTIID